MAERFGRYWLHEKIGQGGMAEVFRATVGEDPEDYAFDLVLKRLHPHLEGDQDQVDMFLTEADISKFLKHPNIVQVYESGIIDGHAYIAMEYVWGFDLAGLLSIMRRRGSPFPPAMAAYIAMQILRALDYAHRATTKTNQPMELIHRDITPSNIYISMRGEVKVGDFGIARVSFLERGGAGVVHGKAAYLPPEILFGEPPEQQNDLWSVAAVFYEMLTLQRVYAGASDENLMTGDVPEGIIPVEELNPSVPGGLSRPLKKALHKREKRRPKDALTFYRQLKSWFLKTGVPSDGQALAGLVGRLAAGSAVADLPYSPVSGGDLDDFRMAEYQADWAMTPTQRWHAIQKRRMTIWPTVAVIVIGSAGVLGWWMGKVRPLIAAQSQAAQSAPVQNPVAEVPKSPVQNALAANKTQENPDYIESLNAGDLFFETKRYWLAARSYEEALALSPDSFAAHYGRAQALFLVKRHAIALKHAQEAARLRPELGEVHFLLGEALRFNGQPDLARLAFERVLKMDVAPDLQRKARMAISKL